MANVKVKNADGNDKYLKATGAGTDEDPYIGEHLETNSPAIKTSLETMDDAVKAEDAAAAGGDKGYNVFGVRRDSDTSPVSDDGDYQNFLFTALGYLKVSIKEAINFIVGGDVAHDSADSGNPVKIGGKARTTNPTAVSNADRVDGMFDKIGRFVMRIGQVRDLMVDQKTTITNSTAATTILTAAASVYHDITQITITNKSNSLTTVTITDDTTDRMDIDVPGPGGAVIPFPRPLNQAAVNKDWKATCSVAVTSVHIHVQAEKNV